MDNRANACSKQLHLLVLIGTAVIKVEHLRSAIFGNSGFHDRHEIYKVIIEKDINADNKAAGIINQSNDINLMFFAVRGCKVRSNTGVAAPYFVDVIAVQIVFK